MKAKYSGHVFRRTKTRDLDSFHPLSTPHLFHRLCSLSFNPRLARKGVDHVVDPVGAKVVWRGQVVPILNRYVDKEGAQYQIHTKARDGALVQDVHVTLGQLLGALNDHATHCVGDKVELTRFDLYIKARWWSFTRGEVFYRINDKLDSGRIRVIPQTELLQRLAVVAAG